MSEFSIFRWLMVPAVILLMIFRKGIAEAFRQLGQGPRGGPPTHPIPATGPIETSRSPKRPEEPSKPRLRASKH